MQSAVLARAIMSVCPSVTLRCFVQMNEDMIVRFTASGRTIPLVSEKNEVYPDIRRASSTGGVKVRHPFIDSEHSTNQCKKTSQFKTQCKGDISLAFETAKITVFYPTLCKTPDAPLQNELLC